ncbi:hypothetical protein [Rhodopirellula bahusiensis]|uniref:Uncharacterized protein n=1 Tax=Rhodopirellula bahusiensis TaxID=2014065 RepID=A0A2G1VZL7_9BACT|nr:hypothetical protein [Rhodopirellula bahusiensis]PHQ32222.1 hypothetical protein CEE69_26720 [Rhodopirellula bahusiensis]
MREPPNLYQTTFVCQEKTRVVSGMGKYLLGDIALVFGVTASGIGLFVRSTNRREFLVAAVCR